MITTEQLLSVGIEEAPDGSARVHSLGFPGCMGEGDTAEAALEDFTGEVVEWLAFREMMGLPVPPRDAELEIAVDEWVAADGTTPVLFAADEAPLTDGDINEGLHLLGDLRGHLLRALKTLPRDALASDPAELPLRQVLDELARAQWWTLTRLGASPLAEVPDSTLGRLDTAMALAVQQFTHFARGDEGWILPLDGELWTARKVLRRLLWLEWSMGRAALAGVARIADGERE